MKKQILLTLALVALFFSTSRAQYQQPPPQISVSGSAEINVAPDEVNISAGVETRDAQLNVAVRQNDQRVADVLAFLKNAGVPEKDVQTAAIEVQPHYGPDNNQIVPDFYLVRKSVEVKLTAITNLEAIVTGLLNNGANNLYAVDFKTTALRKYRDQARTMAIKAAKEKAEALCHDLDVKCGKPLSINAQEYGGYYSWPGFGWGGRGFGYNNYMNSVQNVAQGPGGDSGGTGETVSIGQISVSATVNVSFSIN